MVMFGLFIEDAQAFSDGKISTTDSFSRYSSCKNYKHMIGD